MYHIFDPLIYWGHLGCFQHWAKFISASRTLHLEPSHSFPPMLLIGWIPLIQVLTVTSLRSSSWSYKHMLVVLPITLSYITLLFIAFLTMQNNPSLIYWYTFALPSLNRKLNTESKKYLLNVSSFIYIIPCAWDTVFQPGTDYLLGSWLYFNPWSKWFFCCKFLCLP